MAKRPSAKQLKDLPIPFVTRRTPIILGFKAFGSVILIQLLYILFRVVGPDVSPNLNASSLGFFLLFMLAQLIVIGFFTLYWYVETYEIHDDDVHHNKGVIFRKERTYPYNNIQTITCRQSLLGRAYHYGEVSFFIPTLGEELVFKEIPHPHHFIHTIRNVMPYPDRSRFILHG